MKKIFYVLFAGVMAFGVLFSVSTARPAFAESEGGHDNGVRGAARVALNMPMKVAVENHGQAVSNTARMSPIFSVHGAKGEDENENENNEKEFSTSTPVRMGFFLGFRDYILQLEARFREVLGEQQTTSPVLTSSVTVSNVQATGATVSWNTDIPATSKVYYAAGATVDPATASVAKVKGFTSAHSVDLSGLTPGTAYAYIVESADILGNNTRSSQGSFTTLGTQVPELSITSPTASSITSSSAMIAWTTNIDATGKVYYSTTTPVDSTTATVVSNATLQTNHSFGLSGLLPNTTYYFVVESTDGASHTVRASEMHFTTARAIPVISEVRVTNVASSSAIITWTTDRPATSKVYFTVGTTMDTSTASWVASPAFTANHVMALGGLNASTTYTFAVESTDNSGTTATTSPISFTTGQ